MLAASYWSLLEPALEMAAGLGTYGERGQWAFLPVSAGRGLCSLYFQVNCYSAVQCSAVQVFSWELSSYTLRMS